jgi:hypothetical protein
MLKKSLISSVLALFFLVFMFGFTSAATSFVVNDTGSVVYVSVYNATNFYSYELSFVDTYTSASNLKFYNVLGSGASVSQGNDTTIFDTGQGTAKIFTVYESRLDSSGTGVDLADGTILFNFTYSSNAPRIRSALNVLENGTEETQNICSETAFCGAWSSCTGGAQSRTCTYPTCGYDDVTETQSCTTGVTTTSGGGGGGTTNTITSLKVLFSAPDIKDSGEVIIPVVLQNDGTNSFSEVKITVYFMKNGVRDNDIVINLDKEKIGILGAGSKENITLSTKIVESDISFYEVVLEAEAVAPSYRTSNRAIFTFVGKKAANVLKVVAFTEGIIDEHPECLELKDMIIDAQAEFKAGKTEEAIAKANAAVEACKNYLESPLRPIYSKQTKDNILLYLGIGIIAAILFGIIFNVYRYYKFK